MEIFDSPARGRRRKAPYGQMRRLRAAQNNAGNMRHVIKHHPTMLDCPATI